MSSYRRLISYIYAYEGKKKGKNIGFVKLEAKEGQCKLGLNVKKVYVEGNDMGVYLLGKDGQETFLSNVFIRNGCGEFRTVVDAVNVMGTGNSLDTYYGLTIHDVKNSWRSYTTIWEDSVSHMAQEELPGTQDKSVPQDQVVSKVVKEIESEIAKEENRKTGEENIRTRAAELGMSAAARMPEPVRKSGTEDSRNSEVSAEREQESPVSAGLPNNRMPGSEGGMMRRGGSQGPMRQPAQPRQANQAGQMNQIRPQGQPAPSSRPVQPNQPDRIMEQEKVIVDFSRDRKSVV